MSRTLTISLLKRFALAMSVAHDQPRQIHARPMAVADIHADGDIWLVTACASATVQNARSDSDRRSGLVL